MTAGLPDDSLEHRGPIAALATGQGGAAVAIIRLSGAGCHQILRRCLLDDAAASWPPRQLRRAQVVDHRTAEMLDDAMVVFFYAPSSYTGEDSGEIHAHGSPYVVQRILSLLFALGCRPAAPGEFTRRAFLNGKLDLTAAEGIRELVEAQTHQQWVAARHLASGKLRTTIEALRTSLIGAMAFLEAQIDFPDEGDTADLHLGLVRQRLRDVQQQLSALAASYSDGRVASQGLMVVLFGAPNAGKSTLMNTLLGRERAIVTPIAGTTRDYLEERCLVRGRLIRLVDLAGMRAADDVADPVEAIGIAAAQRLASEADVVLFLAAADAAEPLTALASWIAALHPRAYLKLKTKTDLAAAEHWQDDWLAVSCQSGEGISQLQEHLAAKVDACVVGLGNEPAFVTSARHVAAIRAALEALEHYFSADAAGAYEELLAFELQQAVAALASIVGQVGNEDVLDRIFSEFCVGK